MHTHLAPHERQHFHRGTGEHGSLLFSFFAVCDDDLKRRTHARLRAAAFKAAMLKAEVQDIEGGCQLLVLPNDAGRPVHWLGLDSSVLFVRPVFKHFYEELLREFTRDTTSQRYHNLLRGVSGIGKSSFGM